MVYNGVEALVPVIAAAGSSLAAEGCGVGNGAIDPGETVTVLLSLANTGNGNATSVVGTLQASGGVTSPSGPQDYGTLVAGGPSTTRPFTFVAAGTCGGTLEATLELTDGATALGTVHFDFGLGALVPGSSASFGNSALINIPTGSATATPYPSTVNVSGLSGTVTKVTATLNGLSHAFADDVDILLVGPGGQTIILMADAGGGAKPSNVTLTFDDDAALALPDGSPLPSGTYRPGNYAGSDTFPAPAPGPPYGSALSVFNGTSPNGAWKLYVTDDFSSLDGGSISGGWSLTIQTATRQCCTGPSAGITVSPTSGLVTTEAGGTATFTVALTSTPSANVTIGLTSSDTTEGTVSPPSLTFTPADALTPKTVTVTGAQRHGRRRQRQLRPSSRPGGERGPCLQRPQRRRRLGHQPRRRRHRHHRQPDVRAGDHRVRRHRLIHHRPELDPFGERDNRHHQLRHDGRNGLARLGDLHARQRPGPADGDRDRCR